MASPNYNKPGQFPGPSKNSCDVDDPMIKRVPFDRMDIASRKSGMPTSKELTADNQMGLDHVGGSTKK